MTRTAFCLLVAVMITSCGRPAPEPPFLSVCALSRDFGAYRNRFIAVRGVYYYGLRESCPQKCSDGTWPSFLELGGTESDGPDQGATTFATDWASWEAVHEVQQTVELEAKKGKRLEVWVTAIGELRTGVKVSPLGPCDKIGSRHFGYGHLGWAAALLVVQRFSDIQIKANPDSPFDYSHMYRGAL